MTAVTATAARDPGPEAGIDLLSLWRRGGFLLECGGLGVVAADGARRIDIPAGPDQAVRAARLADATLASLGVDDAVIAGSLPYRGDQAASLAVPSRVTVSSIAPRTVTVVSGDGGQADPDAAAPGASTVSAVTRPPAAGASGAVQRRPPPQLRWRPEPPTADFGAAVAEAVRRIEAGALKKVVLARSLTSANPGIDVGALLAELRRRNPGCHVFATAAPDGATFVGATPETLVRREGDRVISLPLAGTAGRSADPALDREISEALLRSVKDLHEHAPVVEAVADALAPHCRELDVEATPHLVATSTAWHLATSVRGRLRDPAPSAIALAAALHPTPAVCGTPADAAAALIAELEPVSRGLYSGLVGWVDGRGDGEWAVSLRCALITPRLVRLHAGAGIVAGSDPAAEIAETEVKFRTMVEALEAAAPPPGGDR
jgi:isochorismate synthase